jgi:hypothetical protein
MENTERKLLVPALRATLQQKRTLLEQLKFAVNEHGRIEERAFEEGRRARGIKNDKQKLAENVQEEIKTLERMIKEYNGA